MPRLLPALAVFFLVAGCGLLALFVPIPLFAKILLVLAAGFIATGAILTLSPPAPHEPPQPQPAQSEITPQLRHDLRGILSPAVLSADQLTFSADETTRTRATQILDALDRATERLKSART